MSILITNIKELVNIEEIPMSFVAGKEMSELKTLKNAWLLIENDRIKDFGSMETLPYDLQSRLSDSGIKHYELFNTTSSPPHIPTSPPAPLSPPAPPSPQVTGHES
ncbi:MAG: hypothetical protein HQ542_06665, partial [Bacteroidia bacterium]|nr:hypothetical protein [Bacteroidia bacterium]